MLGYAIAAGRGITGDHDRARRAAARSTNSTLTTLGAIGGGLVGGPPGVMAGGASMNAVGLASEHGISKHIQDKTVEFESKLATLAWSVFL